MNRGELIEAISDFFAINEKGGLSEKEENLLVTKIMQLTPNSMVTDLIFYGERERTAQEVADEALLREKLFAEGGREAVEGHIEQQYRIAFDDPATPLPNRFSIVHVLEGITGKEIPEMRESVTRAHAAEFGGSNEIR